MILVICLKSRLSSSWLPFWTLYPRFSWAWRQHCWWTLHRSVGLRCSCEGSVRCLQQPPTSLWRWCERWCWGGGLSPTLPTETPGKIVTRVNEITIDVANLLELFQGESMRRVWCSILVPFLQNISSLGKSLLWTK